MPRRFYVTMPPNAPELLVPGITPLDPPWCAAQGIAPNAPPHTNRNLLALEKSPYLV